MNVIKRMIIPIDKHLDRVSAAVRTGSTSDVLCITLTEAGKVYPLDGVSMAAVRCTKPDGRQVYNACVIKDNEILYTVTTQTTVREGTVDCELELFDDAGGKSVSARFELKVFGELYPDDVIESLNEYGTIQTLLSEASNTNEFASSMAADASRSAYEANESAVSATASATAAYGSETAAESAKDAAVGAAGDALGYKEAASLYAGTAEGAKDLAEMYAGAAGQYAGDAAGAMNAAISAKEDAVSAKNDAVSAKNNAEYARDEADSACDAAIEARADAIRAVDYAIDFVGNTAKQVSRNKAGVKGLAKANNLDAQNEQVCLFANDECTLELADGFSNNKVYALCFTSGSSSSGTLVDVYTNTGKLCAVADNPTASAQQFDDEISEDRRTINSELNSRQTALWLAEKYNGSTTEFTLKNLSTNKYLRNNNGLLDAGTNKDARTVWTLKNMTNEGLIFKALVPTNDTTKFVRVSHGSNQWRFGSTSNDTDGRNANLFLYVTSEENITHVYMTDPVITDRRAVGISVATEDPVGTVYASNNAGALVPTWEDVTSDVKNKKMHTFVTTPADGFGIAVKHVTDHACSSLSWKAEYSEESSLPDVTSSDNNKFLTVTNGAWEKSTHAFPPTNNVPEGKVLTVTGQNGNMSWEDPTGGGVEYATTEDLEIGVYYNGSMHTVYRKVIEQTLNLQRRITTCTYVADEGNGLGWPVLKVSGTVLFDGQIENIVGMKDDTNVGIITVKTTSLVDSYIMDDSSNTAKLILMIEYYE